MAVLSPMTTLEAVNRMLASIGQAPVNTLIVPGVGDAAQALQHLTETTRDVEELGWSWNSDEAYELTPDTTDGAIVLPSGVLDIDASDKSTNVVVRKHPTRGVPVLYDKDNHTFDFRDTVPDTLEVDIVWGFPFDELPAPARSYIATAAARRFQAQKVSSTILDRFNAEDQESAWLKLQRYEARASDTNIFRRSPALRRWTGRRAL